METFISKKQLREFGLIIGLGLPIFIGWILPSIGGNHFKFWTLWIAIPSLLTGVLQPSLLYYPYKAWMSLGYCLGWVNSRIILGLIFLLILQPIALIMKVFGYDPLKKKKSKDKSYRENKENHEIDLTRIF
tara:strand:+ start:1589 stop:1981 length:393 start_codon:yes stop_codon:yes gene_type:complete